MTPGSTVQRDAAHDALDRIDALIARAERAADQVVERYEPTTTTEDPDDRPR